MADTPTVAGAKFSRIAADFASPAVLRRVGKAGADDATGVIRRAIGDTSMSHFSRRKPIDLTVHAYVTSDHEITFGPDRRAVGASVVLDRGHKGYAAGDRRLTGKVSKKTGNALTRKVKRNTTAHAGKGTTREGHRLIQLRTSKRIHDEWVKTLKREFRG